jgi:hypothetical protein
VETPEQMARARAAGCAYGQGHMIAAPMPDDHVVDWLARHQPPSVQTHADQRLLVTSAGVRRRLCFRWSVLCHQGPHITTFAPPRRA